MANTTPDTGELTATVTLSVITSTSAWSSATRSPTATYQAANGLGDAVAHVRQSEFVARHR